MAIKELQTRIALKYDSYANWTNADVADQGANLVLLKGELGICEIKATNEQTKDAGIIPTVLFKVGDGETPFKGLPWASAKAADVYSWAKSETVVLDGTTIKFKTGDKVNHSIDLSSFATDAEVETIRSGLDSRITALEGKFTGDNDVQGQLDALDGRLDVIEGADTVEGSVAKALKDAKAYTDTRETAITTAYEAYANQAEADANTYTDGKVTTINAELTSLDGRLDVIEGEGDGSIKKAVAAAVTEVKAYADTAESDAVATAKSYTDTREAAIKTAYEAYADQAEADAKAYSDGKLSTAVNTINAKDLAQDTEIAKKLDASVYTAYINGKELSDAELKSYADGKASAAQSAAITAAKTETETQISTLVTSGQVKTNTDAIAQNKADIAAMDTAYKKAVSDEAKAREDADKALSDRIDSIDAFFAAADHDGEEGGLNDALDTLKEIQDYLNGEGSATNGMLGRLTQAETDIDNLEKEFNTDTGRVKVAEGKISALEAKDTELNNAIGTKLATDTFNTWKGTHENDHAPSATQIASDIATAVSGEETARKAADKAITDAIGTSADGKDVATVYGAIADAKAAGTDAAAAASAVAGRMDTAEGEIDALQGASHTHANKAELDLIVSGDKAKWDDAYAKRHEHANKAELDLIATGDKAKWDTAATNAGNAVANLAELTGNNGRVKAAENAIDALELIVNDASKGNDKLRTDVNALQTLTGDAAKGNEALYTEVTRVAGLVDNATTGLAATKAIADKNKTDIGTLNGKVAAIEGDYLKAADVYVFNCGSATTVTHEAPKAE